MSPTPPPSPAPPRLPSSRPRELDDVTLTRAVRGDRDALEALVIHYQELVHAYLARLLVAGPDDARVEDVAQDTFIRVLHGLPTFDRAGPARLSSWILTIATRLAIDLLRRGRHVQVALDQEILVARSRTDGASVSRAVRAAVQSLSADQRAAFLLHELYDCTHAEIAAILGIELGTVKSRIARARARLSAALESGR